MNNENFEEYFKRYEGNPILTLENWPYKVGAVFNPGAIKFNIFYFSFYRMSFGSS